MVNVNLGNIIFGSASLYFKLWIIHVRNIHIKHIRRPSFWFSIIITRPLLRIILLDIYPTSRMLFTTNIRVHICPCHNKIVTVNQRPMSRRIQSPMIISSKDLSPFLRNLKPLRLLSRKTLSRCEPRGTHSNQI